MLFNDLRGRGFDVQFLSHAEAILHMDFPDAVSDLESVFSDFNIPIEEIMAGGGGEAKSTQRLRKALERHHWAKTTFTVEKVINGRALESQSHEVDHVKQYPSGFRVALEIEWNNKDPFFDRDLENFKRLHADGAISIGIIVTRGRSLHESMYGYVQRFLELHSIDNLKRLEDFGFFPTRTQRFEIEKRVLRDNNPIAFRTAFAKKFVSDKFGEATTHWRKLEDRVRRGVGNPCPLVLIGLPGSIITFKSSDAWISSAETLNHDR